MNERVDLGRSADQPGTRTQSPDLPAPPARPRRRGRALLAGIAALALLVGGAYWGFAQLGSGPSVRYVTAQVSRGPVVRAVTATGTVNPELTIIVGTYVSGVIQELFCDYNTVVKQGQICAKIDPRPFQTAVDQAQANLAIARAQLDKDKAHLEYTRIVFERAARLIQTNAVSKDAYDSARSNLEQARAQIAFDEATIQQRQAALDNAQVQLGYTNITSPVDGVVVSRNVTRGQTVAASFQTPTLFLIASDLTRMQVDTNVSESDIGGIEDGKSATFTVDAFRNRTFEGRVTQVRQSPQTVQNVVTYDVVVTVDNSDLALKPGMTAATRIVIDRRDDVLRVPNAALRYRPSTVDIRAIPQDRAQVWVLRDGAPAAVTVERGLDDESFTETRSGLAPGEQVITGEQRVAARTTLPRLGL